MADWGASLRSPTPEDWSKSSKHHDEADRGGGRVTEEDLAVLSTERNHLREELDLSFREDPKAFVPDPFALNKIRAAFKANNAPRKQAANGFGSSSSPRVAASDASERRTIREGLRPAEEPEDTPERRDTGASMTNGRTVRKRQDDQDAARRAAPKITGLVAASKVDAYGQVDADCSQPADDPDDPGRKRHSGWVGLDGKPLQTKRPKHHQENGSSASGNVRIIPGRGVVASVIGNTIAPSTYKPPLSVVERAEKRKAAKAAKDAEKARVKAEKQAKKAKDALLAAIDKPPKASKRKAATGGEALVKKRESKKKKTDDASGGDEKESTPQFRRIPKDAAPTDDFPIVKGLEKQRSLLIKKRSKESAAGERSPFPLSMPATQTSSDQPDLDKLLEGVTNGAAEKPSKSKPSCAPEDPSAADSDIESLDMDPEEQEGRELVMQKFLGSGTLPLQVVEQELDLIPNGDEPPPAEAPESSVRMTDTSSSQIPYSSPLDGKSKTASWNTMHHPKPHKHADDRALSALALSTANSSSDTFRSPTHEVSHSHHSVQQGDTSWSTLPAKSRSRKMSGKVSDPYGQPSNNNPAPSARSIRISNKFSLPLAPFRKPPPPGYGSLASDENTDPPCFEFGPMVPAKHRDGSFPKLTLFKPAPPKPPATVMPTNSYRVETLRGAQYGGAASTRLDSLKRFAYVGESPATPEPPVPPQRPSFAQNVKSAMERSQDQADEEWETGWTRDTAVAARHSINRQASSVLQRSFENGYVTQEGVDDSQQAKHVRQAVDQPEHAANDGFIAQRRHTRDESAAFASNQFIRQPGYRLSTSHHASQHQASAYQSPYTAAPALQPSFNFARADGADNNSPADSSYGSSRLTNHPVTPASREHATHTQTNPWRSTPWSGPSADQSLNDLPFMRVLY